MKYQIQIEGMHCTGCSSLIKMSLDDEGMANVKIDAETGSASFDSSLNNESKVKVILDKVFTDLQGYSYTNIQTI